MFNRICQFILLFGFAAAPLAADHYYKHGYKHRHGAREHFHSYHGDPHGRFYPSHAYKDYYRPYQNRWGYSYSKGRPHSPRYRHYQKDHTYRYRHGHGHPVKRYHERRPDEGYKRFVRWKQHKQRMDVRRSGQASPRSPGGGLN